MVERIPAVSSDKPYLPRRANPARLPLGGIAKEFTVLIAVLSLSLVLLTTLILAAMIIRRLQVSLNTEKVRADEREDVINVRDAQIAGLSAKLNKLHLSAMRLLARSDSTKLSSGPASSKSGDSWYWCAWYTNSGESAKYSTEQIEAMKPTVDAWIEFANDFVKDAELNHDAEAAQNEEREKMRQAREEANVTARLGLLFHVLFSAQELLKYEQGCGSVKSLRDHMVLWFLGEYKRFIEHDMEEHPDSCWSMGSTRHQAGIHSVDLGHLRRMLADLVQHHNAEYMKALDGLPAGVAQELLRLTVEEPVMVEEPAAST